MNDLFVGKFVWYRARAHEAGPYAGSAPLAAMVTAISEIIANRVNLLVIGAQGTFHPVKGVAYYDGDNRPDAPGYAEPMNAVRPKQPEPVPENPPSDEDDDDPRKPEVRRRRRG